MFSPIISALLGLGGTAAQQGMIPWGNLSPRPPSPPPPPLEDPTLEEDIMRDMPRRMRVTPPPPGPVAGAAEIRAYYQEFPHVGISPAHARTMKGNVGVPGGMHGAREYGGEMLDATSKSIAKNSPYAEAILSFLGPVGRGAAWGVGMGDATLRILNDMAKARYRGR